MTLGSHQRTIGRSQEYITPLYLIEKLGPFDLDPCAAHIRPWDCARENWTMRGLDRPWVGRVYLNPPFNRYEAGDWVARLAAHGCGTALLHARTETEWFEPVWRRASLILFLSGRLTFCKVDGTLHPANSGAPPVLAAFGSYDAERLWSSGLRGAYVETAAFKC